MARRPPRVPRNRLPSEHTPGRVLGPESTSAGVSGRGGKCGHWDGRPRTPARAGRAGQGWGAPAGGAAWAGPGARTCRAAAAVGARRGQRKTPGRSAQVCEYKPCGAYF